jgi:THO complex subunit 2
MSWHADPNTFEAECSHHPGFLTVFRNAPGQTNPSTTPTSAANKQEQLDYENYRHVCHKWHYKLTKSFIVCLESEEYVQMRNSLIILTKILPYYPKLTGFSMALEKRVEKIKQTEKEKRQDIFTLAMAYLGQLKQRKQLMVDESKFHLKETNSSAASTNGTSQSVEPATKSKSTSSAQSKTQSTTSDSNKFKQPQVPKSGSSKFF